MRRSHWHVLDGVGIPFPDLHSVPLFFRSLDEPRLVASLADGQGKPFLPLLGGPRCDKSYFPPILVLMQRMRSNGRASKVPSLHSWPPCHATKPKALWPLAWISATRRAVAICRFLPRRLPTGLSLGLLRRLRRSPRRWSLWRCLLGRDRCGYRPSLAPSKISKCSSAAFMGFNQRTLQLRNGTKSQ
jgi:hypothetical protein